MQDVVERIWDFIDDFNLNSILKFLKDNIVGTVVVISLLFWIPISCLISYVDRKRAEKVIRVSRDHRKMLLMLHCYEKLFAYNINSKTITI
jgi:disintegrin and metalloproteinase domain-containing protein 17